MIMKKEQEAVIRRHGGQSVPREIWKRYEKEMAENRERYEIAERIRRVRTHQLAITTVII